MSIKKMMINTWIWGFPMFKYVQINPQMARHPFYIIGISLGQVPHICKLHHQYQYQGFSGVAERLRSREGIFNSFFPMHGLMKGPCWAFPVFTGDVFTLSFFWGVLVISWSLHPMLFSFLVASCSIHPINMKLISYHWDVAQNLH